MKENGPIGVHRLLSPFKYTDLTTSAC